MPRKGFMDITIKEETHRRLKHEYETIKDELALQGIYTFGGYCTKILQDMFEKADQQES